MIKWWESATTGTGTYKRPSRAPFWASLSVHDPPLLYFKHIKFLILTSIRTGPSFFTLMRADPASKNITWIRIRILGQNTLESSSCWMGSWERDRQSQILTSVSTEPLITTVDSSLNLTQFTEASKNKQNSWWHFDEQRVRYIFIWENYLDFKYWLHSAAFQVEPWENRAINTFLMS